MHAMHRVRIIADARILGREHRVANVLHVLVGKAHARALREDAL